MDSASVLDEFLHLQLEAAHKTCAEVAVLEDDPGAAFGGLLDHLDGGGLDAAAEAECLGLAAHAHSVCEGHEVVHGVGHVVEEEEEWFNIGGVLEGLVKVEDLRLVVLVAEDGLNVDAGVRVDAV